jgi:uncharacterized protein YbjT (DUF2867 family)
MNPFIRSRVLLGVPQRPLHRRSAFRRKYAVERMIEDCDLPVTILRPNYFMQNDTSMKNALLDQGIYPQPIGSKGISWSMGTRQ